MKQSLEETKEVQVVHGVVLSDYVIKVKPKKGERSTKTRYTFCLTSQQFVASRRKNSSRSFIIQSSFYSFPIISCNKHIRNMLSNRTQYMYRRIEAFIYSSEVRFCSELFLLSARVSMCGNQIGQSTDDRTNTVDLITIINYLVCWLQCH